MINKISNFLKTKYLLLNVNFIYQNNYKQSNNLYFSYGNIPNSNIYKFFNTLQLFHKSDLPNDLKLNLLQKIKNTYSKDFDISLNNIDSIYSFLYCYSKDIEDNKIRFNSLPIIQNILKEDFSNFLNLFFINQYFKLKHDKDKQEYNFIELVNIHLHYLDQKSLIDLQISLKELNTKNLYVEDDKFHNSYHSYLIGIMKSSPHFFNELNSIFEKHLINQEIIKFSNSSDNHKPNKTIQKI